MFSSSIYQLLSSMFLVLLSSLYNILSTLLSLILGESILLECSAIGTPVPTVTWYKQTGLLPTNRSTIVPGGLKIYNITASDDGVYLCKHNNSEGEKVLHITLIYNEPPSVIAGPRNASMKEGDNIELSCTVTGTPEPVISWFLNGKSALNISNIEAIGNKIYFRPLEKEHAGILQCFATNVAGTDYSSADLNVYPKQISESRNPPHSKTNSNNHKHGKHGSKRPKNWHSPKMIPPSKPNVTRVNDESVVVRWSASNEGLPILFFKVQYKDLGSRSEDGSFTNRNSKWKTTSADISPNVMSYEVNSLKPDHTYKFRIAAVYSNNDNKLSQKSEFYLRREDFFDRNPLPIPKLTHTEAINSTAIRVYWEVSHTKNKSYINQFYSI